MFLEVLHMEKWHAAADIESENFAQNKNGHQRKVNRKCSKIRDVKAKIRKWKKIRRAQKDYTGHFLFVLFENLLVIIHIFFWNNKIGL